MTAITGNTYPVKDQLKALGGKWDPEAKAWMMPDSKAEEAKAIVAAAPKDAAPKQGSCRPTKCKMCGRRAERYNPIYRNGECRQCYIDRKEEND